MFKSKKTWLYILVGLLVAVGAYLYFEGGSRSAVDNVNKAKNLVTGSDGFSYDESTPGYETYKDLSQGCPVKDCIPSIDNPVFETIDQADRWLESRDVVFVLELNEEVKAYPQRVLNWHEIVNDEIGGEPVAVTFCPLCGSSLAFDRELNSRLLELGVSGKLKDNDLVMYDRQTDSLWQQITGEAIVGELKGEKLEQIPLGGMRWEDFKEEFNSAQILSRDTGYQRDYSRSPYGSYEQDAAPLFPVEGGVDDTIHPKTFVYGVRVNGQAKAYQEAKIEEEGRIIDTVAGSQITIEYNNGDVTVQDEIGDEIAATRLFWFAWKAFNPETKLY